MTSGDVFWCFYTFVSKTVCELQSVYNNIAELTSFKFQRAIPQKPALTPDHTHFFTDRAA